jgi:hypothetical protein
MGVSRMFNLVKERKRRPPQWWSEFHSPPTAGTRYGALRNAERAGSEDLPAVDRLERATRYDLMVRREKV